LRTCGTCHWHSAARTGVVLPNIPVLGVAPNGAEACAAPDPRSLPVPASKLGAVAGTSPSIEVAAPPAQRPAARLRLAERQRCGAECRRRLAKRRGGLRRAESWPSGELRSATAPHQAPSRASGSTSRRACVLTSSPAPPKPPKPAILPRGAHPLRPTAHSCSRSAHLRATLQQPEPLPLVASSLCLWQSACN